jgi:nuclear pore complex protein Nup98-Nup96
MLRSLMPGRIKQLIIDQTQDPEQSPLFNRENRERLLKGAPISDKHITGLIKPQRLPPEDLPPEDFLPEDELLDDEPREPQISLLSQIYMKPDTPSLNHLPILTKHGYYTRPSLEDMKTMSVQQLSSIPTFTIGCSNKGSVTFDSPTNVLNLNIDEIALFEDHSIELYPDNLTKPPPGEGLNKPAILTIIGCWPKDKSSGEFRRDQQSCTKYADILKKKSIRMGAEFLSYSAIDGAWVFRVGGF